MKNLLFIFSFFLIELCNGQFMPTDSIRFNRYIDDTNNFVSIPLSDFRYLDNTRLKSRFGWLSERSLEQSDSISTVLIEMNSFVPDGEWRDYTPGSFQLAFELPNFTTEVNLDTVDLKLINHYATRGGTNDPTTEIVGNLSFTHLENQTVLIDGKISVNTKKPTTKQELLLSNALLRKVSIEQYVFEEEEKDRIEKQQEEEMFDRMMRVYSIQGQFYDSIFSVEHFPKNSIWIHGKKLRKHEFKLDASYIVAGTRISEEPTDNLMELLGSSIYYPTDGKDFVFNFHHFDEGDSNVIDDETNYSFLFSLPNLEIRTYDIQNEQINANLSYWHYGPMGHVIDNKSASGTIQITDISNIVEGTIDLTFKMTDKRTMNLTGNFQLPLVDKSAFRKLAERMQNEVNK